MKNPEQQPRERLLRVLREKSGYSDGVVGLFASLAPQINCEFHQSFDPSFFDYDEISDRVKKGRIRQAGSDIFPDTESDIEKQFFYLQYDLRKNNLRKILEHEIDNKDVILELGSGTLDKGGNSFTSSSVRRELASRFMHCDINQSVAEQNKEICPNANFKEADILQLEKYYPEHSVDLIVGLNVFDTMSKKDLLQALTQCSKVLKSGGRIIHLMNIEPYVHSFYRNAILEDQISIPLVLHGTNRKIISLSKSEYERIRNELNHPEEEKIFLDYLATLSAIQQERLWTGLIHSEYQSLINDIAIKLEPYGKVIDPFELYCDILKTSLSETGFIHIEEDDEESSRTIDATHLPALSRQRIIAGPKGIQLIPDTTLPEQSTLVVIETHVIKAKL